MEVTTAGYTVDLYVPIVLAVFLLLTVFNISLSSIWRRVCATVVDFRRYREDRAVRLKRESAKQSRSALYQRRLHEARQANTPEPIDPEFLFDGQVVYTYRTNRPFYIQMTGGRYGLNCSIAMVCYRNVFDTDDSVADTIWHLEESIFLKQFYTYGENLHDYLKN